jgi:hypothetical protein
VGAESRKRDGRVEGKARGRRKVCPEARRRRRRRRRSRPPSAWFWYSRLYYSAAHEHSHEHCPVIE